MRLHVAKIEATCIHEHARVLRRQLCEGRHRGRRRQRAARSHSVLLQAVECASQPAGGGGGGGIGGLHAGGDDKPERRRVLVRTVEAALCASGSSDAPCCAPHGPELLAANGEAKGGGEPEQRRVRTHEDGAVRKQRVHVRAHRTAPLENTRVHSSHTVRRKRASARRDAGWAPSAMR